MSETILPVLETVCDRCEGAGTYRHFGDRIRCDVCDGAGYVPTEWGMRVLSLLRHNFRPLFGDMRAECDGLHAD